MKWSFRHALSVGKHAGPLVSIAMWMPELLVNIWQLACKKSDPMSLVASDAWYNWCQRSWSCFREFFHLRRDPMHVFQTKPEIAIHCIAKPILIILELAIETCLEVFSAHKQRPANGVILEVTWHLDGPPSLRHPIALQAGIGQSGGTYSSSGVHALSCVFSTWRPKQDGRHFPDDILKCNFLNENV